MSSFNYVIIGAGMTAAAAVKGIRELDQHGSIALIGREAHPPYARPPLSKKLWRGKPEESIWRGTERLEVTLVTGRSCIGLDPLRREVVDDHGDVYGYEKLLLATGGSPRTLPFASDAIIYYRTLDDYRRLRRIADAGGSIIVVGGGFIGSEVAASLAQNGLKPIMIFPEQAIGSRLFPAELADYVTDRFRQQGVTIVPNTLVAAVSERNSTVVVKTTVGTEYSGSVIVAGLGIVPEVELAAAAGLPVADGIRVDEYLRAGFPDIYAAGDNANFFNPLLETWIRVEHEDNAVTMGKTAGRNMAGAEEYYHYLPAFYSDLFDMGYEAVGELNAGLETVIDWQERYRQGVIYYLRESRVRGVLLWNVWHRLDAARELIGSRSRVTAETLIGKIAP